jgi:hypothetical protein
VTATISGNPLPKYKCHKIVQALKIKEIKANSFREFEIFFDDERFGPILVDLKWIGKHEPLAGGYYVAYDDDYRSYSPADVFEAGYTRVLSLPEAVMGAGKD